MEILLDVPEDEKIDADTGAPLKVISVEVSEKLEIPAGETDRQRLQAAPVCRCRRHRNLPPASSPPRCPITPIAKCKADVGLLSHLIVSKYADHLPLYRQNSILEREGVDIPRATQTSWLMQVYESIRPLETVLQKAVLERDVLFTDDHARSSAGQGKRQGKEGPSLGLSAGRSGTAADGL